MSRYLTGLWRHPDFLKLWSAETISQVGDQVTLLALPLTAVLLLDASPLQMGILTAVGSLPSLLLALPAGVWVDRRARRPILVAADLGRALLLGLIPLAALAGLLRIELLYVVAFLVGLLGLFFEVAYRAYLPSLIGRDDLVEGNSKLELSRSAAEIAGPGLAGGLVALVTAPVAIGADALSFLVSALLVSRIAAPEPSAPPDPAASRRRELVAGIRIVLGSPTLRALCGTAGTLSLFNSIIEAVVLLYLTRSLELSPALLGVVYAAANVGFVLGALLAGRAERRRRSGWTITLGIALAALGDLLVPLAGGPRPLVIAAILGGEFLFGLGLTLYNVNQMSLRQAVTPDTLQGRMHAAFHLANAGPVPLGALVGGALGATLGLRLTLAIGAAGELLALGWVIVSPLLPEQKRSIAAEERGDAM